MRTKRLIAGSVFVLVAVLLRAAPAGAQPAELLDVDQADGTDVLTTFGDGGFFVQGERGTGTIPIEGSGTRLMWYPAKAALRAGRVLGSEWDDANIGAKSVAIGSNTVASGVNSVALGDGSTATASEAVAIGRSPEATADGATALGSGVDALGTHSTAMGISTIASGFAATALGYHASTAGYDGTFVYGDNSTIADLTATGPNQFLVRAKGGVGLGTNSPQTQLDVTRSVSGGAGDVGNHVVHLDNPATSGGDVLIVQSGADQPGSGINFVTFRSANGNIGAIQGNGSGGVELISGSGDFAEMLPRERPNEQIEAGDVVGLYGGEITKRTQGADRVMVVTDRALAVGNDPGPEVRADHEKVALIGQVPVTTRGPVEAGELLVASGEEDGTARAVPPSAYEPADDGPVVGRAWEAASGEGVQKVTAGVGLGSGTRELGRRLSDQAEKIEALQHENRILRQRMSRLEAVVDQLAESEGSHGPR